MDSLTAMRFGPHLQSKASDQNPEVRKEALQEVSKAFVGFFMGQVYKTMRPEMDPNAFGRGGRTEQIFQEMMDGELAMEHAESESFGLSRLVYESLMRKSGMAGKGAA